MWLYCSLKSLEKGNKGIKGKVNGGHEGVLEEFVTLEKTIGNGTWIKEEFGSKWCKKKLEDYEQMLQYYILLHIRLWIDVAILYSNEDEKQDERFWSKI